MQCPRADIEGGQMAVWAWYICCIEIKGAKRLIEGGVEADVPDPDPRCGGLRRCEVGGIRS
jgi:hypothetical protein